MNGYLPTIPAALVSFPPAPRRFSWYPPSTFVDEGATRSHDVFAVWI